MLLPQKIELPKETFRAIVLPALEQWLMAVGRMPKVQELVDIDFQTKGDKVTLVLKFKTEEVEVSYF